ncbi:MAG: VOC family protein [Candidatus Dormibacteria bacterium]
MTSDTELSREFYCQLFGWGTEGPDPRFGGYMVFTKDGVPVAGIMGKGPEATYPDVWSIYLATDDARKTVETAVARSGSAVCVAPMDLVELGTMAVVTDPDGAPIGAWQGGCPEVRGI